MSVRSNLRAPLAMNHIPPWFEPDALFAWDPYVDIDAAAMDPTLGGTLAKVSAGSATAGAPGVGAWDMTNGVYAGATGMTASLDTTVPFLLAAVLDKNAGATAAFQVAFQIGSSFFIDLDSGTGGTVPRWRYALSGFSPTTQTCIAAMPAAGTRLVYWTYCNPAAGTIEYGNNQNTFSTLSGQSVPATNFPARNTTVGAAFGSTTNVSKFLQGLTQVVGNRSGGAALTKVQALAIVQKMMDKGT